jgi:hypothetical protein
MRRASGFPGLTRGFSCLAYNKDNTSKFSLCNAELLLIHKMEFEDNETFPKEKTMLECAFIESNYKP